MSSADIHVDQMSTIVERGLDMTDNTLFVINPGQESIQEFVMTLSERNGTPTVWLFVEGGTLKEVLDDFLIASRMADLTEKERLAVRELSDVPRTSLLLTSETLITVVDGGEQMAGLSTSENGFVTTTYHHYRRRWERAEEFSLRTPPLSRIRQSMAAEIGTEAVDDFEVILDTLETARGDGEGLDEVTISLLVAAINRELLYDISRWGEDIHLASKATFSRAKNELEDAGVIDTEKVPIEVGRPRLRLVLGNSELQNADIETVVERTQTRLA